MESSAEVERLRLTNARLESMVQELQLEISYYKGEAKRLEWEKDVLRTDVQRMSSLFKTWIDSEHSSSRIIDRPEKLSTMVKHPCRSISELMQLQEGIMFMTSCQPPHFIEYVNRKWSEECGWMPSEVLGLTCSFLQGELTNKATTEAFMNDIRSMGFAQMKVYNYRKTGEVFEVDVTVYPVFDSISSMGPDAEVAVLTHFASVMTDIRQCQGPLPPSTGTSSASSSSSADQTSTTAVPAAPLCTDDTSGSVSDITEQSALRKRDRNDTSSPSLSDSAQSSASSKESAVSSHPPVVDRRNLSLRSLPKCGILRENFRQFGNTMRLSNLLRLILNAHDAMVLTDATGRILHVNTAWVDLTGYELNQVEGQTCKFLHGSETDAASIAACRSAMTERRPFEMQVVNYRRNGERFLNHVTIVPLQGGYLEEKVSHFSALCQAVEPDSPQDAASAIVSDDSTQPTKKSRHG